MSSNAIADSISGQWTILRAGAQDVGGLEIPSMPLSVATAAGPIRLAVGQEGEARLLLPLTAQEKPLGIDAGEALVVTVSSFMQKGQAHRFLDLVCRSLELEPVFADVVDEIVHRVSQDTGCVEAVRTTLDDFRALLVARPPERIDRSRVAGLVAELVVLNRLLDLSPRAWRAWKGPTADRHDFRTAATSLEVKASVRAGSETITVNGLDQMEPPAGGSLHLAHFVFEPVSGGPLTVGGLARRALDIVDDPSALRELLLAIGCSDINADAWNKESFILNAQALYRVEGSFPRIAPTLFVDGRAPTGVGEVIYRIDLSLAARFVCSDNEFDALLQTIAL